MNGTFVRVGMASMWDFSLDWKDLSAFAVNLNTFFEGTPPNQDKA